MARRAAAPYPAKATTFATPPPRPGATGAQTPAAISALARAKPSSSPRPSSAARRAPSWAALVRTSRAWAYRTTWTTPSERVRISGNARADSTRACAVGRRTEYTGTVVSLVTHRSRLQGVRDIAEHGGHFG